jgi:hypothetical protein
METIGDIAYAHSAKSKKEEMDTLGKEALTSLGGCALMFVTLLIMRPLSFVMYGFVAVWYWLWFAIPFAGKYFDYTLEPISWGYGIALVMFTHFLCNREELRINNKKENEEMNIAETYSACIVHPLALFSAYLGFGWIIKTICM